MVARLRSGTVGIGKGHLPFLKRVLPAETPMTQYTTIQHKILPKLWQYLEYFGQKEKNQTPTSLYSSGSKSTTDSETIKNTFYWH